jgi:SOS-response transcriptional repressor LexA
MANQRSTNTNMTVGERILARMKALGLNQTQLAKKMGVSRTTVGFWVSDKHVIRNDKIPRLAAILGLEPSALSPFGGGTVAPVDRTRKSNYVVLLSWGDLIHVAGGGKMKMSALKKPGYIEVDIEISPESRALRIEDSSMEMVGNGTPSRGSRSFRKGDVIILDPNIDPIDGDYVLVRIRQTNEHIFRLYIPRGRGAYDLVAENPDFPTVTINAKFPAEMMGVLVEHRQKRHKA